MSKTELVRLIDVVDINPHYDLTENSRDYFIEMAAVDESTGDVKYFKSKENANSGSSRFKEGDILFARITPCTENGKVAIARGLKDEVGLGSTEFIVLSPKKVLPEWLYFLLKTPEIKDEAIKNMEGTTGRQRVPTDFFKTLYINVPPQERQRQIVKTLVSIREISKKNSKAQELSSAYPLALFNKMFNNSERKWEFKSLADTCEFLDNLRKPVKESVRKPGPYPYYGANGQVGTIDDYLFDEPLVLLAEDGGNWGDPSRHIAYEISGKSWVNNHAHVLRPEKGFDISFILYSIAHTDIQHLISGTTRGKLTKKSAESIPIIHAPVELQQKFGKSITAFRKVQENQTKSAEKLNLLFASLSSKYFTALNTDT